MTAGQAWSPQPVAVVGMACRLPGAADPVAFWDLLSSGRSAVTEVPAGRWPATSQLPRGVRRGGFLDQVDLFDPEFFGVSRRQAGAMDPRQRLMLELAWETLEDAGTIPGTLSGRDLGVYVGTTGDDFAAVTAGRTGRYHFTGAGRNMISDRVAHMLAVRGPSFTVDAGQASALTAVDLAAQDVAAGAVEMALAGGVSIHLVPDGALSAAAAGALSRTGDCRAFDRRADGYVRGEGAAVVLLKPLRAAVAAGDRIYGVLIGSARGRGTGARGLTDPDPTAQVRTVRAALVRAGVDPGQVGYVETHGTGTPAGDRAEARALAEVFGAGRASDDLLIIGSVKPTVGHLEGAAGAAGLLKTLLCLHHRAIPATVNFSIPSLPLPQWGLRVATKLEPWPATKGTRIAGVTSLGLGGTICHVVLSEAPGSAPAPVSDGEGPARSVLLLSASTMGALKAQASRLHAALSDVARPSLESVCRTLALGRTHFRYRAAVLAPGHSDVLDALDAVAGLRDHPAVVTAATRPDPGLLAFVFAGQGGRRPGPRQDLNRMFPVYSSVYRDVCSAFDDHLDRPLQPLVDDFDQHDDPLRFARYAQPAIFADQIAQAALLAEAGVRPDIVAGHSVGEYAAAYIAGVFSLETAAAMVAARGREMDLLPPGGTMAVVRAAAEDVLVHLADHEVEIAAVNGPRSTVIAGHSDAVHRALPVLAAAGLALRPLQVTHAFHSALMEPMLGGFARVALATPMSAPRLKFVSTCTGKLAKSGDIDTAEYWIRQIREPVRFVEAIGSLVELGVGCFVGLGSDGAVADLVRGCLPGADQCVTGLLGGAADEASAVRKALATLHVHGYPVAWSALLPQGEPVTLPTYPFQRVSCSLDDDFPSPGAPTAAEEHDQAPVVVARADDETLLDGPSWIRHLVRTETATVLGLSPTTDIAPDRSFRDLGLDSIGVIDLAGRLARATGQPLPTEALYEHPTVTALAGHLGNGTDTRATQRHEPSALDALPSGLDAVPSDEALVIIGVGCRLPGGVASLADLWSLLTDGTDATGPAPQDRGWSDEPAYHGGFLRDAALFDADFFGVGPREAAAMDPQQRLLLEVAWEALENAGIRPSRLRGTQTGIYVGVTPMEYGPRLHESGPGDEPASDAGYRLTGTAVSVASGRLAYVLGTNGPAVTVDSACSSALVAIHQAALGLRAGDCDLALAGGAAVMATPGMFIEFAHQGGLAPNGRCKAFSAHADGTTWAEGSAVLVIQRLGDARRNGHRVYGLIRGSAVNSDGTSNGLTAPNGTAQRQVIDIALRRSGLHPSDVDAVEAHGTGTALGDPVEVAALAEAYRPDGVADRPLWIGSIKSNIGHAQAAAGAIGIVKMLLALEHGMLPRTLYASPPAPAVTRTGGAVRVLTAPVPWPDRGTPRRAAVSAFGISGTNAHLILESPPTDEMATGSPGQTATSGATVIWPVSARTAAALRAQAGRLHDWLAAHPDLNLAAAGRLLATGREVFACRAVAYGRTNSELRHQLTQIAGTPHDRTPAPPESLGPALDAHVRAFLAGEPVDWAPVLPAGQGPPPTLPTYPFQRQRFWHSVAETQPRLSGNAPYPATLARPDWRPVTGRGQAVRYAVLGTPAAAAALGLPDARCVADLDALTRVEDPEVLLYPCHPVTDDMPAAVAELTGRVLALVRLWCARTGPAPGRLVLATRQAVTTGTSDPVRDGAGGAVWGLGRAAQAEHPGRIGLLDLPWHGSAAAVLAAIGALDTSDRLAVRRGSVLAEAFSVVSQTSHPALLPPGTVLVTGGTGALGALIARHLIRYHGARRLLLASRRGPAAPDAARLREELSAAGAAIDIAAVDLADRTAIARLVDRIPGTDPLVGVVHAAGVMPSATVARQSSDLLEEALRAKAFGAWHLHELTVGLALRQFVLFSSTAGALGHAGEASYAAANAFLDALASLRVASGLPATSIAWGLWDTPSALTERLGETQRGRLARSGLGVLNPTEALDLYDRAVAAPYPMMLAAAINQRLVTHDRQPGREPASRLGELRGGPRQRELLRLVRSSAATVLGHAGPAAVLPGRALRDAGVDSLAGTEMVRMLSTATGLSLPATLPFDYPTPQELAAHLSELLASGNDVATTPTGTYQTRGDHE
ncbi:SDR family NAD(P)-dependent oxidoreductase [Solwaraspora sp. WMMB335]|uniref:SDR family NAD(P)-dependent oxidoreductase n=1 Tax=Solwaraspora sp. WMMB335 TaxID=3404118 RepID=UPI003B9673CC